MSLIDRLTGRRPKAKTRPGPGDASRDASRAAGSPPPAASVRPAASGSSAASSAPPAAAARPAKPVGVAPAFPRFVSTAGDQVDARLTDRMSSLRIRLRNAYTPGQPVTDRRMFAGRTKVLTTLIRSIEDQRLHTVLYGERGIGKTSLLHVLAQAAREARYLVVYVSCGAASEFDETIRTVAEGIPLLYHSGYGPTTPEAERGDTLADILAPGPVSTRAATDIFAKVVGTRVLIILDEFDRSESAAFRLSIAELRKSLSDRQVRVQFVIAGVAANLTELVRHVPSIQRNVFALQLPKMTGPEVRHLVKNGEDSSGMMFDDEAIKAIVERAIGFPYLASLLSHHASLAAVDEGRTQVTGQDVTAATAEALAELKGRLTLRSQVQIGRCLEKGMLNTLGAVAGAAQSAGGQFNLDDLEAVSAGGEETGRRRSAVESLVKDGALIEQVEDEAGRHYRFTDEAAPSYLWLLAVQGRPIERPEQHDADAAPERLVAMKI
ncbi:MAG: AAA family ATPase [Caulobacteraceae bacterium]